MNKTFENCIREARQDKGFSQRKLADLVHVHRTYISKLENSGAEYPPREKVIQSLAHHLGLDANELRHLAGRVTPEEARIIREVIKAYPGQMPKLFRQMLLSLEVAQKILSF